MSLKKYVSRPVIILLAVSTFFSCKKDENAPVDFCTAHPELCGKNYDDATFLMTHNSFSVEGKYLSFNQSYPISRQLNDGVRGLMIDVYDSPQGAMVYHGIEFGGKEKLVDVLKPIKDFLDDNPNEIVSIIFQNECTHAALQAGIIAAGLDPYAYVHDGTWPLLSDMVAANDRLVLFVEFERSAEAREPWLHYAWDIMFDTPYSFKDPEDFNCDVYRGGGGTRELFLVNHWLSSDLGLPDKSKALQANNRAEVSERVNECGATQTINFLGVDFYHIGEAKAVVDSMNSN